MKKRAFNNPSFYLASLIQYAFIKKLLEYETDLLLTLCLYSEILFPAEPSCEDFFSAGESCKDGLNWYLYCSANPMTRTDPTGLEDYGVWKASEEKRIAEETRKRDEDRQKRLKETKIKEDVPKFLKSLSAEYENRAESKIPYGHDSSLNAAVGDCYDGARTPLAKALNDIGYNGSVIGSQTMETLIENFTDGKERTEDYFLSEESAGKYFIIKVEFAPSYTPDEDTIDVMFPDEVNHNWRAGSGLKADNTADHILNGKGGGGGEVYTPLPWGTPTVYGKTTFLEYSTYIDDQLELRRPADTAKESVIYKFYEIDPEKALKAGWKK